MRFPFAIFDIDGTLVDSRAMISTCMDGAFVASGLPAPGYEKTRRVIGLSLEVGLKQLAADADAATLKAILENYRQIFMANRSDPRFMSPLYDGASQLLHSLVEQDWQLGIATGKSRRGLDAMMAQFGWSNLFATHWCADDGPGKPHPHMVLANMEAIGATPAYSVTIGDSEHDMAMARAAGTYAVGVTWGFGTRGEMHAAGAHEIVDTMDELTRILARFRANSLPEKQTTF